MLKITLKIVAFIFIWIIIAFFYQKNYDSLEKKYAVGWVVGKEIGLRQGFYVNFNFEFQGEKLTNTSSQENYSVSKGEFYLVEIPVKKVNKAKMLLDYPVPDTLKAPYEGWDEIPAFLKKREGT
ncbi:hypothetical protein [Cyclobacterium roseum]|uniref:hypothetical protein n=1 Tax=Cyclobacterium roseum TaxID=2666137 RepID=UPI00139150F2|nr:hypothetical protein [Cyclobacterium roseum]